jgi:small multidrug resistance pump
MGYIYLSISIIAEVVGTTALKAADGFTNPGPTLLAVASYGVAFFALSFVFRTVPMGIAYAIWCGIGIALISLVGVFLYKQSLDAPAILGIVLIVAGVAVINLYSRVSV